MGIDALTHRNDGSKVATPVTHDDWRQWVSAGRTRNWMLNDPLVDWLQLYAKSRDYVPRQELAGYAKELDFVEFIFEKGRGFEAGILRLLQEQYEVTTIAHDHEEVRRLDKAKETFAAMRQGALVIYQAVLWDAHNLNYGSPDFLVRSDVLRQLFPESISEQEAAASAPDLGDNAWHYRVVDTKFTTLHLNSRGTELTNDGSGPAYKAQVYVYNRMLGRLQGFEAPESYLLGRGWQLKSKGVIHRSASAIERLGPVPQNGTTTNQVLIADAVEEALSWVRRVRTEGQEWQLLPEPSVPELYPNMGGADDEYDVGNRPRRVGTGRRGRWTGRPVGGRQKVAGGRVERIDPAMAGGSEQTQGCPFQRHLPLGRSRAYASESWNQGCKAGANFAATVGGQQG